MTNIDTGHAITTFCIIFFIVASYAIFFSAFSPATNIPVLHALAEDQHYKYFSILIIPVTFYFVIANWVGWQYYSNS
ncbi:hypothetical protein D9756_001626 [Leucocoprinus leucothites]|uniref:Uncharacterized protein n=1 Tax=Leucocoprinus leucothites TaxID=201217 RepID=A0A8H5G4I4_9AGAR|nr:hypothetical protein D9756_001626 [Leucoagaricus leucothites]